MRCLYCGKELALFKRLRGGEFCSDAHRQHYQEEYTQLALNRLLQANSPGETESGKTQTTKAPETKPSDTRPLDTRPPADKRPPDSRPMETPALRRRERREESPVAPAARESASPAMAAPQTFARAAGVPEVSVQTAVLEPEPTVAAQVSQESSAPKPQTILSTQVEVAAIEPDPGESAPAEVAGIFIELPLPMMADISAISRPEATLLSSVAPELPRMQEFRLDPNGAVLSAAGSVAARRSAPADCYAAPRERGLEVREFVRSQPFVEIRLAPVSEAGFGMSQPSDSQQVRSQQLIEVDFDPVPPPNLPQFWQQSVREFSVPEPVFVESAPLDLDTTAWSGAAIEEKPAVVAALKLDPSKADAPRVENPQVEISKPAARTIQIVPPAQEPSRPRPFLADPVFAKRVSPSAPVSLDPAFLAGLTGSVAQPAAASSEPRERPQTPPAVVSSPAPALIPDAITQPMPLTLHGLAPARGKATQVFSSALPPTAAEIQAPRQNTLPLRPVMVLGTMPPVEAENKVPAEKPVRAVPDKPEPRPSNGKPRKSEVRVLPLQQREDARKGEGKTEFKLDIKRVPAQQKEAPKPEPVFQANADISPVPSPAVAVKKESPEPAKPAAKETKLAPPAASKPVVEASTTPSPKETKSKPNAVEAVKEVEPPLPAEQDLLGLPKLDLEAEGSFWTKLPAAARIGVAAGLLAAVAAGIFLTSKGSSATRAAIARSQDSAVIPAGPPIGSDAGWATDWFTDSPGARQARHVDVLKGSLPLRDYRMEFEGQIEQQAIGWVFRANSKANFYVEKIAIITPGLEPTVALMRFAVIGGKEQPRVQIALPIKAHLDTLFKVRTDVVGQQFTTWVQDEKVDEWTDSRIDAGGAGMYYDSGDSAKLKGTITLTPLKAR